MKIFFYTLFFLLILGIGAFLGVIYSGVYDVAATSGHSFFTQWVADVTVAHSVRNRSRNLVLPGWFSSDDPDQRFAVYDRHCVGCHGAPGIAPHDLPKRMEPPPPLMTKAAKYWSPQALFWIVTHGIKMTGMPSFEKALSEDQRWHLVAFLRTLPTMTSGQYAKLKEAARPASAAPAH